MTPDQAALDELQHAARTTPPVPADRRSRGRSRRRWRLVMAVGVALLVVVGASCKQLHEDNRAANIPNAQNGKLASGWLSPVRSGCSVYWEAAESLRLMLDHAAREGVTITPTSCYRDYAGQVAARESWCAQGACHMAAVPGTSNHGWGKAVDFREGSSPMTYVSKGYQWLLKNAGMYGWLHPKAMKQDGPVPEPWHWEWVGDGGRMFPYEYFGLGNALPMTGSPIGNLETVSAGSGQVTIGGWTFDPDTQEPIDVHVYIDGNGAGAYRADRSRPDVGAAFPAYSTRGHGFSQVIPVAPGARRVCVYAINAMAPGVNVELGCRTVDVPGSAIAAAAVPEAPAPTPAPAPSAPSTTGAPTTTTAPTTTAPPAADGRNGATTTSAVR